MKTDQPSDKLITTVVPFRQRRNVQNLTYNHELHEFTSVVLDVTLCSHIGTSLPQTSTPLTAETDLHLDILKILLSSDVVYKVSPCAKVKQIKSSGLYYSIGIFQIYISISICSRSRQFGSYYCRLYWRWIWRGPAKCLTSKIRNLSTMIGIDAPSTKGKFLISGSLVGSWATNRTPSLSAPRRQQTAVVFTYQLFSNNHMSKGAEIILPFLAFSDSVSFSLNMDRHIFPGHLRLQP